MTKSTRHQKRSSVARQRPPDHFIPPSSSTTERRTVKIRYFAVAFIDLLGYGQRLLALDEIDFSGDIDGGEIGDTIRAVVDDLAEVRRAFREYCNVSESTRRKIMDASDEQLMGVDRRTIMSRIKQSRVDFRFVSDSVILSAPLDDSDGRHSIACVDSMICACAGIFLACLSKNVPLRGAMEVGKGTDYFDGEVISQALVRAYEMEKHKANFPRIVIGAELIEYLEMTRDLGSTDRVKHGRASRMAATLLTCIGKDGDGVSYLDYLAPTLIDRFGHIYSDMIPGAWNFVQESLSRYEKEQNVKLHARYEILAKYFHERIGDGLPSVVLPAPNR